MPVFVRLGIVELYVPHAVPLFSAYVTVAFVGLTLLIPLQLNALPSYVLFGFDTVAVIVPGLTIHVYVALDA